MVQIIVVFLTVILSLALPQTSHASYVIKLKNGREFVTSRYWVEGKQIMFYTSGGIMGIDKDLISKIEDSDRPITIETMRPSTSEPEKEAESQAPEVEDKAETGGGQKGAEAKKKEEKVDFERYKKENQKIRGKFDEAYARYQEALRNEDWKEKEKARLEMMEFSRQFFELSDELRKKNKGVLPDWWEEKGRQ